MGESSEPSHKQDNGVLHVEKVSSSDSIQKSEHLEDLDSIEKTQSGKFAWLVSITAGVGGMLFGTHSFYYLFGIQTSLY